MRLLPMVLAILLAFFHFTDPAVAGLAIAPALVELKLEDGKASGEFIITNTGDEEVRYRIQPSHFTMDARGELKIIPPDDNSLFDWIKFNPKELVMPPKSKQRVRYVIVPRGKPKEQEYWVAMELESLKSNITESKEEGGKTVAVEMTSAILVPIFATNGAVSPGFSIGDVAWKPMKNGGHRLNVKIHNTGNVHLLLSGEYTVVNGSGQEVAKGGLGRNFYMPGNVQAVGGNIKEPLPKGEYEIRISMKSGREGLAPQTKTLKLSL